MEPISGLEYVMPTKITILQGRAGKVFFHGAGWGRARTKICGAGHILCMYIYMIYISAD